MIRGQLLIAYKMLNINIKTYEGVKENNVANQSN